jgi:menaquinone-dependent protoporphyrinogen oxidase
VFRGALQYSKYGPIKRRVVQAFAAVGGHDTDTSRDYDYTDWKAVDRFATAFAVLVT